MDEYADSARVWSACQVLGKVRGGAAHLPAQAAGLLRRIVNLVPIAGVLISAHVLGMMFSGGVFEIVLGWNCCLSCNVNEIVEAPERLAKSIRKQFGDLPVPHKLKKVEVLRCLPERIEEQIVDVAVCQFLFLVDGSVAFLFAVVRSTPQA